MGAGEAIVTIDDGCVAIVGEGAERRRYEARIDQLEPVATVGSGDCFLAGYVAARYEGATPRECLAFGVACGAESHPALRRRHARPARGRAPAAAGRRPRARDPRGRALTATRPEPEMNPVPAASSAAALPEAGGAAVACAWCARPCDAGLERLARPGSLPRAAARRPPTRSPPTPSSRAPTPPGTARPRAGSWIRPTRSSPARAAVLARRLDESAPPGPVLDVGAGDGTLIRALAGAAARRSGPSGRLRVRRSARATSAISAALGGDRLLALARASSRRRARCSSTPPACSTRAGCW